MTLLYVGSQGSVIVSGMSSARGAAIQGGDQGTVIEGVVDCSNFTSADAGGKLTFTDTSNVRVSVAFCAATECATNSGHFLQIQGRIAASNITCEDFGAVMSADSIEMSGNAWKCQARC